MKFTVSSGELLSHLQAQSRAIDSKSPIPILENFLFSLSGNKLTITASDSETTIISDLIVNGSEDDGRIAMPGIRLTDYLKRLPEQPVNFSINNETHAIEICTVSGKNTQVGFAADEYPQIPQLEENSQKIQIDADILLSGISSTAFATGNDDLRPIMNGIFFDIEENELTFVATDSHKLARLTRTDVQTGINASFVLGKKPTNIIKNVISKSDGLIDIEFDNKNVVFASANYKIFCRHIQGTYPQYKSVIPPNNPFNITVNRADLINTIGRAALFTDGTGLVKLDINPNIMSIVTQDLDFSCGSEETISCIYDNEPITIGFKANFFTDILSNMESQDIILKLSDPSRPGIVIPAEQKKNEDLLMLIMPMKI